MFNEIGEADVVLIPGEDITVLLDQLHHLLPLVRGKVVSELDLGPVRLLLEWRMALRPPRDSTQVVSLYVWGSVVTTLVAVTGLHLKTDGLSWAVLADISQDGPCRQ